MHDLTKYSSLRFHLDVSVDCPDAVGKMKVFGWVCCRADIFKCTLRLDQAVFHAPVGYPRPDVFRAINPDSRYPFMNSYFCGVDANFAFSERKLVGISGLTCRAALSDKKGTIFAERMFEFDQDGKASLS